MALLTLLGSHFREICGTVGLVVLVAEIDDDTVSAHLLTQKQGRGAS
jgi:hypothetical protein